MRAAVAGLLILAACVGVYAVDVSRSASRAPRALYGRSKCHLRVASLCLLLLPRTSVYGDPVGCLTGSVHLI